MKEPIRVLYVDDDPTLLEIGKLFLERTTDFSVKTLESALTALNALGQESFDAIISDYQMPDVDGIELLKRVRESGNPIPFILFTGRGREEVVIQALNEGADFYLQKGGDPKSQFAELSHKIQQAVRQRRLEVRIKNHERLETDIINFLPDATFAINTGGIIIAWNRAMEKLTGLSASKMVGSGNFEYALPFYHERRPILIDLVLRDDPDTSLKYSSIQREDSHLSAEITLREFQGRFNQSFWFTASPLYDNSGTVIGAIESIRDVTQSRRAEETLRLDESRLEALLELNQMIGESLHDITHFALEQAVRLTGSTVGYIAFVSEDESVLTMYAWSSEAMQECRVDEIPLIYPIESTGLWGESVRQRIPVITNNYSAENPLKKGTPRGHISLTRHMSVPVFDEDRIVVVAGVGNKDGDYDISDIRQLGLLMSGMWTIIQRKNAELQIVRNHEELQAAYEEISATEEELRANLDEFAWHEKTIRESRRQIDAMASNIPGVVYRFNVNSDGTYGFHYISERSAKLLGLKNDPDTFFEDILKGIVPSDRERFLRSIKHAIHAKTLWEFEGQYMAPSGNTLWLKAVSSPIIEDGKLIFDGVIFDNSDQKRKDEFTRLLAKMSDDAPAAIMVHDFSGGPLYANEQTFRLHGYSREEFFAKNIAEIEVTDGDNVVHEGITQIQLTGSGDFDVYHIHKDGFTIPLHVTAKIIEWGDMQVMLRIATDLSERKRYEKALHDAHQKIRLLTGLTRHDIFNQLTIIKGSFDLAEEFYPEFPDYLFRAREASEQIEKMIGFSQEYENSGLVSSGWQQIYAMIELTKSEIPLCGISIINQIPVGLEVYADPIIRKVFTTFFDNAVRHGGTVSMVRFSCYECLDNLIITYENDGEGIGDDEKELIFTKGYGKNTGIGLYLVREILSACSLSIRECAEPSKGVRFEISVPNGKFRYS